jgi:excisionase family DNA binding protein
MKVLLADDLLQGMKQGAEYVGLPEKAFAHLVTKGAIPSIRMGTRAVYFRKSELDAAFTAKRANAA